MRDWRGETVKRIKGPSAQTLLTSIFAQTFILVTGVIAARALGVEGRGALALLWLLPLTLSLLGGLGVPQATTYYVAQKSQEVGGTVRTSMRIMAVLAAVASLLYGVGLVLAEPSGPYSLMDGVISVALVPLLMAQNLGTATLLGMERYASFNATRLLPVFLYVLGSALLFILGAATVTSILAACAASWILAGACTWTLITRYLPPASGGPEAVAPREIVGFGARGVIGSVSPVADVRIDQLLVGFLLDARALGLYVSAAAFGNLPRLVGQSIASVNYPRVAGARDREAAWSSAIRAAAIGLLAITITVTGLILAIPFLLPFLFGEEFRDAVSLGYVLLLAAFFLSVHRLLAELARGLGHPGYGSITELVNLGIFSVGLLAFATPASGEGIASAVLAGGVSSAVVLTLLLVRLRKKQLHESPPS